jgi:hypothetical protein
MKTDHKPRSHSRFNINVLLSPPTGSRYHHQAGRTRPSTKELPL